MDIILGYESFGIVIALIIGIIGYGIFSLGRRFQRKGSKWLFKGTGCIILLLFLVLLGGSVYHVYQVISLEQKYPPPGEIYDVDGIKMHIWAEGTNVKNNDGQLSPTIIFIPGSYSPGIYMWHLHKEISKETRSILFDRAGTGWSQKSPYPRHVKRDNLELKKLLDAAGEKSPFILVGHSWGGFFAINFAYYHPDMVAGLVIFEGVPPSTGAEAEGLLGGVKFSRIESIAKLFGATSFLMKWVEWGEEVDPDSPQFIYEPLREVWDLCETSEIKAQTSWSTAVSYKAKIDNPEIQVIEEEALGDIPIYAIYRSAWASGERVSKLSKKGVFIRPPEGSTHNFPYGFPEYCSEKIREMIALVMEGNNSE
ncbi:MAG: alpha/beta hydrolase [Desulfobacteraceae bacterium]|jgi:pimeloyl-ACP methyl ester carboxylesterase